MREVKAEISLKWSGILPGERGKTANLSHLVGNFAIQAGNNDLASHDWPNLLPFESDRSEEVAPKTFSRSLVRPKGRRNACLKPFPLPCPDLRVRGSRT